MSTLDLGRNGILSHSLFDKLWKPPLYPVEVHAKCLALMRHLKVAFQANEGMDIVPSMLPRPRPDHQLIWVAKDLSRRQYDRTWRFEFLPIGLTHHLITRMYPSQKIFYLIQCMGVGVMKLITAHSVWQYGCVASLQMDWALIEELTESQTLRVSVRSANDDTPLLSLLIDVVEQLLSNFYPEAEFKVLVRCNHCLGQGPSELLISEFSIEECETALLAGASTIQCARQAVAIGELAPDLALKQHSKYRIPLQEIEMEKEKLAEGAYGVLYRGIHKGSPVAVKLLRTDGLTETECISVFREFRREVSFMAGLLNENVVQLKGFCFGEGQIGMVMNLVDSGDLHTLIRERNKRLSSALYLKIAFDIAQGLHFLHTLPVPILHRDLKPPNILLSSSPNQSKYVAQLADFGLSTRQYFPTLVERAVETPIWLAPEILGSGRYTAKSDVYAFGIILYEMVEGKMPFENFDFRFLNQLEDEIISGKRSDLSSIEATKPNVAHLIRSCWDTDPLMRPDFLEIMLAIVTIAQETKRWLYKELIPRYKAVEQNIRDAAKQKDAICGATTANLDGRLLKRVQTDPPESASCIVMAGNDIWVAHKNGDISIWNSESGKHFRTLVAAHSRDIQTMITVDSRVWTGSTDGMIRIWRSRSTQPSAASSQSVKEGYLDPGDGRPAMFVVMKDGCKELIDGVSLVSSRTTPIEGNKTGFVVTSSDGIPHKYFCADSKDRDEWVQAINYATQNLSEQTQVSNLTQVYCVVRYL